MKRADPEIYRKILDETKRENDNIELIASENFVSEEVLEAQGSSLTNKYAEGYPGARWYNGCANVDTVEEIAIARAKKNIQSRARERPASFGHSGEYGDIFYGAEIRRHGDGHGSGLRRTFVAWQPA